MIWGPPKHRNRHARCGQCGQAPSWNHMASEIQVNRALKAPRELASPANARLFRELAEHDPSRALRVVRPAAGLRDAAAEWMGFPATLVNEPGQGCWADHRRARTPRYLLGEIMDRIEEAGHGAEFWSYETLLA